eukprot:6491843-Amphidinium_carterae.2
MKRLASKEVASAGGKAAPEFKLGSLQAATPSAARKLLASLLLAHDGVFVCRYSNASQLKSSTWNTSCMCGMKRWRRKRRKSSWVDLEESSKRRGVRCGEPLE